MRPDFHYRWEYCDLLGPLMSFETILPSLIMYISFEVRYYYFLSLPEKRINQICVFILRQ